MTVAFVIGQILARGQVLARGVGDFGIGDQQVVCRVVHGHADVVQHVARGDHVFAEGEPAECCTQNDQGFINMQ